MKEKLIKEIREHLENGSLSFIVGAGFSRNISDAFPLWGGLLNDLVLEMYPEYLSKDKKLQEMCIQQKISELGYLGVASEYVRRKGYHEAIDLYIEKHMPYLKLRENGGFDLMQDGVVIDSEPSLECHKMFLALKPKHIFTFNYDNCLDVLGDVKTSADLQKLMNDTKYQLRCLQDKLKDFIEAYDKLRKIKFQKLINDGTAFSEEDGNLCIKINEILKACNVQTLNFDSTNDIEETYKYNFNAIKTEEARLKGIIQSCEDKRKDKYQLIRNAYEISITDGRKNIYKLHGDLRTNKDGTYGFDGDKYIQYVITQEDYDDYPTKHEAFVNLMRISLLKGSFCLIGFSGDDPNFIAWINWVKDVLDKGAEYTSNNRPIYYVNPEDNHLPSDKELLLKNHYIEIINLADIFPGAEGYKGRMCAFFKSVRTDKESYKQYDLCWKDIEFKRDKIELNPKLSEKIDIAYNFSNYNLIPNQFGLGHYHRTNLFALRNRILNSAMDLTTCAKLFYSAIRGELLPINAVLEPRQINKLSKQSPELGKLYGTMSHRANCLSGQIVEDYSSESNIYESLLSRLFHLKFNEAKADIKNWQPQSCVCKMRQFLLLSIFDNSVNAEAITNFLIEENFDCQQNYKFALDILSSIRGIVSDTGNGLSLFGDLQARIDALTRKNSSLVKVWEVIDDLFNDVRGKNSLQPYGNIKKSINFSSYNTVYVNSVKILQVLLEFGIPVETHHVLMLAKEKWEVICKNLYEDFPYPCLYFTLQYGNTKDLLKKIAQDYIFSYKLKDTIPELLKLMLEALKDDACPRNIKEAIYIIAPVFMKAVPADCWETLFENIYDDFRLDDENVVQRRITQICDFIGTGVLLSKDVRFKHKVILSNLRLQTKIGDFNNRLIIECIKNIELNDEEKQELGHLCEVASLPVHFYVIMNLEAWIDRAIIVNKLLALPDEVFNDFTLLKASTEYAANKPELQSKLKRLILGSQYLWQTGINDECSCVSHYDYTLEISYIQQHLTFSLNEILDIYEKMKQAFNKVSTITKKWNDRTPWNFMNDWSFILVEMQTFMRNNKSELSGQKDYSKYLSAITRLLNVGRGGNSIAALLVDDKTTNALEWLCDEIMQSGVEKFQNELILVTNRIIVAKSEYLHSCFIHFGWIITKYEHQFNRRLFKPILKNILDAYKPYYSGLREIQWDISYVGKDIVERELLKIYKVYSQWGGKIAFWEKYKARYYS